MPHARHIGGAACGLTLRGARPARRSVAPPWLEEVWWITPCQSSLARPRNTTQAGERPGQMMFPTDPSRHHHQAPPGRAGGRPAAPPKAPAHLLSSRVRRSLSLFRWWLRACVRVGWWWWCVGWLEGQDMRKIATLEQQTEVDCKLISMSPLASCTDWFLLCSFADGFWLPSFSATERVRAGLCAATRTRWLC